MNCQFPYCEREGGRTNSTFFPYLCRPHLIRIKYESGHYWFIAGLKGAALSVLLMITIITLMMIII